MASLQQLPLHKHFFIAPGAVVEDKQVIFYLQFITVRFNKIKGILI